MPDPKTTKEIDEKTYLLLQQKALQYREMFRRIGENDDLSLPGEDDGPESVKSVYSEMRRSLSVVCLLDIKDPTRIGAFIESWNKFNNAVYKLAGFRDGKYNPDRELSQKVHAVYEQQDYGSMADDPNCEKLLICANACGAIQSSISGLDRIFKLRQALEPYQDYDKLDSELDSFFRELNNDSELKRIFTEKDAYAKEIESLDTTMSQLQEKLDMTDEQLEVQLSDDQKAELTRQLSTEEEQQRKNANDANNMENAGPELTMEARIAAYRDLITIQNQTNMEENKSIQSSNDTLDQKIQQVEKEFKENKEKLDKEQSRETFLEAQEAKDQQTVKDYQSDATKHRNKETELRGLVGKMRQRQQMLNALDSVSKEVLDEYNTARKSYDPLIQLCNKARKDHKTNELASLKEVCSLYQKLDDYRFRKLLNQRKEAEKAANVPGEKAGKATDKYIALSDQLGRKKIEWPDFETVYELDSMLADNPKIKEDVDKFLKDHPNENILHAVSSVQQTYEENLNKIREKDKAYFNALDQQKELSTIQDPAGNHYENRLSDIESLEQQANQEMKLADEAEAKSKHDFEADRLVAANEYRKQAVIDAEKNQLTKNAEKATEGLRSQKKPLKEIVQIPGDEDIKKNIEKTEEEERRRREEELESAIQSAKQNKKIAFLNEYRTTMGNERLALQQKQDLLKNKSETFHKLFNQTKSRQAEKSKLENDLEAAKQNGALKLDGNILNNVSTALANIDKGKRPLHRDSKEFTEMRKNLKELHKLLKNDVGWMGNPTRLRELIKEKLTSLRDAANHYQDVKRSSDHHIVKDSNMRRLRLTLADGLKDFCNTALQAMKERTEAETNFLQQRTKLLQSTSMNISTESPAAFLNAGLQKQAQPQKVNAESVANQKNKTVAAAPSKKNAGPAAGKH